MNEARIAELLTPFIGACETPGLVRSISTYIDILLRWNARVNLTAIRDPDEIVTRHFGESLFVARRLFPTPDVGTAPGALADVGSGAGFPGLPIKLWAPHLSVTLIESNHKKATFLRELVRTLTLTDINIQNARVDTLPPATFDVVTLRAVERFEAVLPAAARLLKPQGRLALLIGAAQLPTAQSILPDHVFSSPLPIPQSSSRILSLSQGPIGEPR